MRQHRLGCLILAAAGVLLAARPAQAQYKNTSFGFDAGAWLIAKPSPYEADGKTLKPLDRLPLRLDSGVRFGLENNYKMNSDHWWLSGRVHGAFLRYSGGGGSYLADFDALAADKMGTLFAFQAGLGLRYVFLTDRFRPYLQAGMSYAHFFTFGSGSGATCDGSLPAHLCVSGASYTSMFLPHPNIMGLHLEPGVELVVARDLALRLSADMQRWLVLNAGDNFSVVVGLGIVFFS